MRGKLLADDFQGSEVVETFPWDFKDMGDIHCMLLKFHGHEVVCSINVIKGSN